MKESYQSDKPSNSNESSGNLPINWGLLTATRGLAALTIVVYHATALRPAMPEWAEASIGMGYIAVDFFFVLSGFVLTAAYSKRFRAHPKDATRVFLTRRFSRVYPLHLVVLLAYVALPVLYLATGRELPEHFGFDYFLLSILLMQNWGFTESLQWNVPAWSISTEFAAYLTFPILVRLAAAVRSTVWLVVALIVICAAIHAVFSAAGADSIGSNISKLGIWRCIGEFAAGVLSFRILSEADRSRFGRLYIAQFVTAPCFLLCLLIASMYALGLHNFTVVPLGACCLVIAISAVPLSASAKFLPRILIFLGEISYSIYLCHYLLRDYFRLVLQEEAVTSWVHFVAYLIVTVVVSTLLYRCVELPAQRFINGQIRSRARRDARGQFPGN